MKLVKAFMESKLYFKDYYKNFIFPYAAYIFEETNFLKVAWVLFNI